ncbi:unnamed protein product [Closterium sp. Naga37s-1]|nr:unnamed protein product [Closterium sp. Naga37s-1]
MAGRKSSSKPRVRIASFDGLEPVIVVLPDGSIRLFSHDNEPLSARTVLSEFPSMSLASLDSLVSPSAPLLPGETYFLTPRRVSAREEASLIRLATPPPAAWAGTSAFRAPASFPSRSPRALAVLEEELPLDLPLEEPDALAEAGAWCISPATAAATSGGTSRAPRAPPSAVAEAASLKGKVLAAIARFNPRHLRRAASASSSGKEAMAAAPPPGSVKFARRQGDLAPPAMAVGARRGISHMGLMYGNDAESAQGWVDVEGPVLMMTDTRIRHRAPPGFRSSTGMGRQGGFAQQEWHSEITETQFSRGPAGRTNPSAPGELQRAPSLEAAQRGEHPFEHCDEWHSYASGLTRRQRAQVRLSEDSVRERRGNAAVRNEYAMLPSERYLSGPPLQATY